MSKFKSFSIRNVATLATCVFFLSPGTLPARADGGYAFLMTGFLMISVGISSTTAFGVSSDAQSKAQSLIDEAYFGTGDKLEAVARGSNKTTDEVADVIVQLDQAQKLDSRVPVRMLQVIAQALSQ